MSDVTNQLLPLAEGARQFLPPGRGGKPINPATLWRWSRRGIRRPDGITVFLRVRRLGSRSYLAAEDAAKFLDECSAPVAVADPAPVAATPSGNETERILERAGIRRAGGAK